MHTKLLLLVLCAGLARAAKAPAKLLLSPSKLSDSFQGSFDNSPNGNAFEVEFDGENLLSKRQFFLIFESTNSDFSISILDDPENGRNRRTLIDLLTYSGNIVLVMSDTYFNEKLDFIRRSGILRFNVQLRSKSGPMGYSVRVQVGDVLELNANRSYSTRVDMTISRIRANLFYDGSQHPQLHKLRFQLTATKHKDPFSMEASLSYNDQSFHMNNIFGKIVGGILVLPSLPVCREKSCTYMMDFNLNNVKALNIESFLSGDIERLDIDHFDEYYDRTFAENTITTYELPYDESMEGMDISVSLVPVTGAPSLFINARTLQKDLESYDWKEKGGLAKRITIRWAELVAMKAERSSLFIAVNAPKAGEYLLKIDAHEPGYKGRLISGVFEEGFVQYEELLNYLYLFEVVETQPIEFQVDLNTVTGIVNLYLKACDPKTGCKLEKEELNSQGVLRVENDQHSKSIRNSFTCEHTPGSASTLCEFVIGIMGRENHGSHFEISLTPMRFSRLMVPNHILHQKLAADETAFMKFSYPGKGKAQLTLNIEPLWGSFQVFLSRVEQFPSAQSNSRVETFTANKNGLYSAVRTLFYSDFGDTPVQGSYFIGIKAVTACAVNMKFVERESNKPSFHTLFAGVQSRGEITSKSEIVYYTFKVSLDERSASTINLTLTPLKGNYVMFARRDGRLPTPDFKEFSSFNNRLELTRNLSLKEPEEFTVGVKLANDQDFVPNMNYQFMITLNYATRPLRLDPGIILSQLVDTSNVFFIEIHENMNNLLLIKTIKDGYNLELCAVFSSTETGASFDNCNFTAHERTMAIYITESELRAGCKSIAAGSRCLLNISVSGNTNQHFGLGFTYNDQPFHLVKN